MKKINIIMANHPEQISILISLQVKGSKWTVTVCVGSILASSLTTTSAQNSQIINNAPGLPEDSMLLMLHLSLSLFLKKLCIKYECHSQTVCNLNMHNPGEAVKLYLKSEDRVKLQRESTSYEKW